MTCNYSALVDKPELLSDILSLDYDGGMSYLERVRLRHDYIEEQLLLNPDLEFWDYLEHIPGTTNIEDRKEIIYFHYLISSHGRAYVVIKETNCYPLKLTPRPKYVKIWARSDKVNLDVSIHRAVACTMIYPDKNEYDLELNHILVVNHKDGDKLNNFRSNLEWTTHRGNVIHSRENGLHSRVSMSFSNAMIKGKYIVDDQYENMEFKLHGSKEFSDIVNDRGLSLGQGLTTKNGWRSLGFEWHLCDREEFDKLPPIPDFIKDKMKNDKGYLNMSGYFYGVTHVISGFEFYIRGKKDALELGFTHSKVSEYSKIPGRVYRGFTFRRITRLESQHMQRGLTDEQKKTLLITK